MDVSSIAAAGSAMAQARTADAVGISVLKKAIQIETEGVMQLLQALPQPAGTASAARSNPPHLGNNVDVSV